MRRSHDVFGVVLAGVAAAVLMWASAEDAPAPEAPPAPGAAATPAPEAAPPRPAASAEQIAAALAPKASDVGIGDPNAKVKWIEYASSGCPHCAHFSLETLPQLKKEYMDSGKVYYVLRDFPLDGVAAAASLIARCQPKEKFYGFVDQLFADQKDWHNPDVKDLKAAVIAEGVKSGMTADAVNACLNDNAKFDEMKAILKEADEVLAVNSTPTNFINGTKLEGAAPIEDFRKALDAELAK